MTRREKITAILESRLLPLKDSTGGHEAFRAFVQAIATDIMDITRPVEEIIHVIGPNGNHRLIVDGQSSDWKSQTEIVRNGDYVAVTDFYIDQLPQVARVTPIDPKHFMTTSAQTLAKVDVKFVRPS